MPLIQKITPCLWFDDQAEEAVEFYTAVFRNSKIVRVTRYGEAGYESMENRRER
jgi:predicted 3-demethylubiquinone-9 3-methyltransferase (glyoxalase superfamily)